MRRLRFLACLAATLLAACGGGSQTITGSGSGSSSGGSTGPTVAAVTVTSSATEIAADGSTSAVVSATAKDANNNLVAGATVQFTATAGQLAITQATTDANGLATATLSAGSAATGTKITVTASTGGVSGTVDVTVADIHPSINLTTSLPQILSDGSKSATITAVLLSPTMQVVPGAIVAFVASSGSLTVTQATTDANGMATATLVPGLDKSNRTITVTATSGSATATVPVQVTGTKLTVVGPANLQLNGAGIYTITATDSSSAGIANATVALTSANGNTLSAASIVTGTNGQNTVTLTATKSGSDTLTATTLGVTAGIAIAVSPQVFQFTTPATTPTTPSKINLSGSATGPTSQALTVNWQISGTPQVGKTVTFSTTRGTFGNAGPTTVTAVTDASGNATAPAPLSSTIAGPAIVTASATGVSAQADIDFIATAPSAIALQASPGTVPTQGQSTIKAIVRDANNNLVEGATVNFTITHDTTSGSLSLASAVTDAQGSAQSVYTAGATTSASNGVVIQAAATGGTSPTATTNLTVGGLTVFLSLGTGNKINENATFTQFIIPYSIQALDAGGNPVANVPITLTVHPLTYFKGGYTVVGSGWVQTGTPGGAVSAVTACPNEDATSPVASALFNGVLDPGEDGCDGSGHDNNTGLLVTAPYACNSFGNGNKKLDPGGTAVATPSSVTTSAQGSADFTVVYPEDQALWVQVELIATATVSGTETTATSTFVLPIVAAYLTTVTSSPPGDPSPYGVATTCTNPN